MSRYVAEFPKKRVLVVGDVMLDSYVEGKAERISPEAPIPVLLQKTVRHVLGGAGNVAANVAALGGKVTLLGVVGNDEHAKTVRRLCRSQSIGCRLIADRERPTTTKVRFVSGHHQLMRTDIEETMAVRATVENEIVRALRSLPQQDIVIISDYAKGCITKNVLSALRRRFGADNIVADIKPQNASLYRGICAITPNRKETTDLTRIPVHDDASAERAAGMLAAELKTAVILTRGEHGITVCKKAGRECAHYPSEILEVKDVTGAGDTLIAVLALMRACGAPILPAAKLANDAAGIVVGFAGTHALSRAALSEYLLKASTRA